MSDATDPATIDSVLRETRVFPPPAGFAARASISGRAQYEALYRARWTIPRASGPRWPARCDWITPWTRCSTGSRRSPSGSSAASSTAVQLRRPPLRRAASRTRPRSSGRASRASRRVLRYQDLQREVSQFANVLKGLGVKKGDVVASTCRMVPELVIALLACARIGAPHTVIFGGFSAEALAGRIKDCKAKVLVTADGGYRRGKIVPLKENADGAAAACPTLKHVVVYRRTGKHGRDDRRAATTGGTSSMADGLARLPPRAARQRASALHPLHLGLDRQAQGHPAHDRRLPARHAT